MIEHIDKTLVENNLRYRFEYLSTFLNFTVDDIATLNVLGRVAEPLIPIVDDIIFQKSLDFGNVIVNESELSLTSEEMRFRRTSLGKYLKRILRQKSSLTNLNCCVPKTDGTTDCFCA